MITPRAFKRPGGAPRPLGRRRRALGASLLWLLPILLPLWLQQGCTRNRLAKAKVGTSQRGLASWYGPKFHGRPTASGEIFDMEAMTAAHKRLPLGTVVVVEMLSTGRTVQVRINDRGPFIRGRVIDLSRAAARELGLLGQGVAQVELQVVRLGEGRSGPRRSAGYTVQVGAFRKADLADAMRTRVEPASDEATAVVREGDWYKVRVGRGLPYKDAEALRKRLQKRGFQALVLPME